MFAFYIASLASAKGPDTAVLPLGAWVDKVGSHFGHLLHLTQTALEESGRFGEGFTLLCGLLFGDELRIATDFRLDVLTVHQVTDFVDEEVVGVSVANQVVDVAV